jgi:hypothetical protein
MVNQQGKILYKTRCKAGRNHDYKIYKSNRPMRPEDVENVFDLGFLGVEKDFPEQISSLFCKRKKKRNKPLSVEEKKYNRIHAKARVVVIEHTICRIKKFRIMADVFRNRLKKYNHISDIVLRIGQLQGNGYYLAE